MKCNNCGEEIANDSKYCEFCGAKQKKSKRFLWILLIIVLLIGVGTVVYVVIDQNSYSYDYTYEEATDTAVAEQYEEVEEVEQAAPAAEDCSSYGDLIYQYNDIINCDGKRYGTDWDYDYRDCRAYFYAELNDLYFNHFFLSFDFMMNPYKDMNILMLNSSYRIFGLEARNGEIVITTDNYRHDYYTNLSIPQGSIMHVDLEYDRGTVVINNKKLEVTVENADKGNRVLSTIDFGRSINPFQGTISNLRVYNLESIKSDYYEVEKKNSIKSDYYEVEKKNSNKSDYYEVK